MNDATPKAGMSAWSDLLEWQTLDDFQREANEGWCWLAYKGRVVEAYHDHEQRFRFHRLSSNCYLTECITHVMPFQRPPLPNAEIKPKALSGLSALNDWLALRQIKAGQNGELKCSPTNSELLKRRLN